MDSPSAEAFDKTQGRIGSLRSPDKPSRFEAAAKEDGSYSTDVGSTSASFASSDDS